MASNINVKIQGFGRPSTFTENNCYATIFVDNNKLTISTDADEKNKHNSLIRILTLGNSIFEGTSEELIKILSTNQNN